MISLVFYIKKISSGVLLTLFYVAIPKPNWFSSASPLIYICTYLINILVITKLGSFLITMGHIISEVLLRLILHTEL